MSIEQDLKSLLKTSGNVPVKDVAPHHIGISEIVTRLEQTDFQHQTDKYRSDVELLAMDLVNQLRHRAYMMRLRADEFDDLAHNLELLSGKVKDHSLTFFSSSEDIKNLLAEHAHINPTKVEGT